MITVTYKGKKYDSIMDATVQAIIDETTTVLKSKIEPFKKEIQEEGGRVEIIIEDLEGGYVELHDISPKLKEKITQALQQ